MYIYSQRSLKCKWPPTYQYTCMAKYNFSVLQTLHQSYYSNMTMQSCIISPPSPFHCWKSIYLPRTSILSMVTKNLVKYCLRTKKKPRKKLMRFRVAGLKISMMIHNVVHSGNYINDNSKKKTLILKTYSNLKKLYIRYPESV